MEVIITNTKPCSNVSIKAAASKSYAQRAILAACFAPCGEVSHLDGVELSGDILSMIGAIEALGAKVTIGGGGCTVEGVYPIHRRDTPIEINVGESGLAARMLSSVLAVTAKDQVVVNGSGTLLRRDMSELISTLEAMGAQVEHTASRLPLRITPSAQVPQVVEVTGVHSSQGVSGVVMALPFMPQGTRVRVMDLVSVPYVAITQDVMRAFGVECSSEDGVYSVATQGVYHSMDYMVEGDWSGASIMLVAGALGGGISISGLRKDSLQSDRRIVEIMQSVGVDIRWQGDDSVVVSPGGGLRSFEFDATDCPDLFPALSTLATACSGRSVISGADRLRGKESDRAQTIAQEMRRFGVMIDVREDQMAVHGTDMLLSGVEALCHGDHRVAMMCAVMALRIEGQTTISGSECVAKSYKGFWDDISRITTLEHR